jgi:hypothetical protein
MEAPVSSVLPMATLPDVVESDAVFGVFALETHGNAPFEGVKTGDLVFLRRGKHRVQGLRLLGTREDSRNEQAAGLQHAF